MGYGAPASWDTNRTPISTEGIKRKVPLRELHQIGENDPIGDHNRGSGKRGPIRKALSSTGTDVGT